MPYSFPFQIRTPVPRDHYISTEKRGEADNRSCLFPADESFKKFQRLNSYHSQQGKIHLIVIDKFLLLLTAYNNFCSWDEVMKNPEA